MIIWQYSFHEGMSGSKYYCTNVIFLQNPPDIDPSLLPLAAARLTTTISLYVYIYIYILNLIYFEK